MKIKASSWFLIFILLLMAYGVAESLTFRYPEDRILLVLAGGLILVLGAVQLTRELRGRDRTQKAMQEEAKEAVTAGLERRWIGSALGWMAGFFLGVYLLGFLVGSPVFILSYLRVHGTGWLKATSIAVITTAVIYGMFQVALKVQLYRGLIFSLLYS